MIAGVYLIMPFLSDFVRNRGLKGVEYFLIIYFLASVIYAIGKIFDFSLHILDLSFFIDPLAYIMLGYYLHKKEFDISSNKMIIIGFILFLGSLLLRVFLLNEGWFSSSFIYPDSNLVLDIPTVFTATGIFLIFKYKSNLNNSAFLSLFNELFKKLKLNEIILQVSKSSFGMYVNHYIFLFILSYFLKDDNIMNNPILWMPFLTILITMLSFLAIMVLNKIKYIRKLTGYH
jgi:hypothetical protein